MKRKSYGRDAGLTLRMLLTTGLLGLLYVVFAVVLFSVLNVGFVPMLVIVLGLALFQYFTSDKLALKAVRARRSSTQSEAPRAARDDRAAVRDGRPAEAARRDHRHAGAERVRDRPQPEARGRRGHRPASGSGSSRARSRACSPTSSRTSRTATCS